MGGIEFPLAGAIYCCLIEIGITARMQHLEVLCVPVKSDAVGEKCVSFGALPQGSLRIVCSTGFRPVTQNCGQKPVPHSSAAGHVHEGPCDFGWAAVGCENLEGIALCAGDYGFVYGSITARPENRSVVHLTVGSDLNRYEGKVGAELWWHTTRHEARATPLRGVSRLFRIAGRCRTGGGRCRVSL